MNWNEAILKKRCGRKYPKLKRVRAGKIIMGVAAAPLGTSWMALPAAIMINPLHPKVQYQALKIELNTRRRLL